MSPFGKIRVGSAKGTGPRTLPCCAISRSISCAKSPARRACPASASPVLWIPSTCSRYCWESNFNALALGWGVVTAPALSAAPSLCLSPMRGERVPILERQMGYLKLGLMRAVQFLLSLVVLAVAAPPSLGRTTPLPALERLLPQYRFADADVGYFLFDPVNGRILEAHRPDEPRIPASTTKVTTLIAALQILGADYRFETMLFVTGEVNAGTLHGSIYLRGGGDPTLTTDDLQEFVSALRRAGITRIVGSFSFDEGFLLPTHEINARQPVAASYNPGLSALSVNYNRIQLRWQHKLGGTGFATTVLSPADGGVVPLEALGTGLL